MPDEDVDDGTDWITRTHDLKDGEEANLVLGAGFEREEVELMELPPELLAVIEEGGEMAFKGAPDEEAVLCTRDKTYAVKRVETSNTLLLLQPPGGLGDDDDDDDDDAEGAEGADGDRGTPEPIAKKPRKSAPSPKPRDPPETPAEACALALSQQKDAGGASDPNDPKRAKKDITAFAQASSHLELTLIAPRLDAMWARLQSEPHVYAGPERERELDDADAEEGEEDVAAAEAEEEGDADAANEDGAPRRGGRSSSSSNRGFDLEDLVENAQASEMEIIAALDEGPAFVLDGKWRGIEPSYLDHVMDVAIVNAQVCTLVPIRPRWRGERRSLRTSPGTSLRPPLAFNPRSRRLSTPSDAFQLHPSTRRWKGGR
jgi:sister chromatid cohesion protein DCC1